MKSYFLESDLGTYKPKVEEILMIQNVQDEDSRQEVMESTEMVIESDQGSDQEDEGMFENFRRFVHRNIQQSVQLGNLASV